MTSTETRTDTVAAPSPAPAKGQLRLEMAILPVSDVDRAKRFYVNLGWRLDADFPISNDFRVVQVTPTGSPASILFGTGVSNAAPGSAERLVLVVQDIEEARADLIAHGADVGDIFHGQGFRPGTSGRVSGPDPQRQSYGSFASFRDPDGNEWLLQEIKQRLPGR
jgi:catechol 2,3-dioxygenase-like lactoylglutathione lyase family enzyme